MLSAPHTNYDIYHCKHIVTVFTGQEQLLLIQQFVKASMPPKYINIRILCVSEKDKG